MKKEEDVRDEMLLISIGDLATFGYRYEHIETLYKKNISTREKGMLYYDRKHKAWEIFCDRYRSGALMLRTTTQECEYMELHAFIHQMMEEDYMEKLFGAVYIKRFLFGLLCILVSVVAMVFLCISLASLVLEMDFVKNIVVFLLCAGAILLVYYNRHGVYPPS